jgi:uncharacterized protein CbrC (UPF0167 family)
MITFYFRGMPKQLSGYVKSIDSLSSWNCSAAELKEIFGPSGKNESICIIAEFDDSQKPWVLKYRHRAYSFHDMRAFRDDFPEFYIGMDGSIWETDSYSKEPLMRGPGFGIWQQENPIHHP